MPRRDVGGKYLIQNQFKRTERIDLFDLNREWAILTDILIAEAQAWKDRRL